MSVVGSPAEALVHLLRDRAESLAGAESLTGGRLAARITGVPGASAVFVGGVVSYQTQVKVEVLGVPQQVVDVDGVVSAACARAMAEGVRRLLGSTYALSTTGVAGPEQQEGKPVGTVYVGLAGPDGTRAVPLDLAGDRAAIQAATVDAALAELTAALDTTGDAFEEPGRGPQDG